MGIEPIRTKVRSDSNWSASPMAMPFLIYFVLFNKGIKIYIRRTVGLEPTQHWLKVSYSTNWVMLSF